LRTSGGSAPGSPRELRNETGPDELTDEPIDEPTDERAPVPPAEHTG
jgi:hypothetical protein